MFKTADDGHGRLALAAGEVAPRAEESGEVVAMMLVSTTPFFAYTALALPLCVILALLTAVVFIDLRAVNVTRPVLRLVRCPSRNQTLTVEFEEELCGGKRVDVLSCAAFSPGDAVECEKACRPPTQASSTRKPRWPESFI